MKNYEKFKTVEERAKAFGEYCKYKVCNQCKDVNPAKAVKCLLEWLEEEFHEELPLPCPFCGGTRWSKQDQIHNPNKYIVCNRCGYRSPFEFDLDVAIRSHNEICRAVEKSGSR